MDSSEMAKAKGNNSSHRNDIDTKSLWIRKFEKKYGTTITDLEFIDAHILQKEGVVQILNKYIHSRKYEQLAAVIMDGKNARDIDKEIWGKYKVTGKNNYDEIVTLFKPNLSPRQMFILGSFGGTYWRPICSAVTGQCYENQHKKYPEKWFKDIHDSKLTTPFDQYDKKINKYGVKVGTTLDYWEEKKWITKYHPYGWVEWYCDWKMGKRCPDDIRQIKRWLGIAGPKGRFLKRLINLIKKKGGKKYVHDPSISPKIRQTLQHWGYKLTQRDFETL